MRAYRGDRGRRSGAQRDTAAQGFALQRVLTGRRDLDLGMEAGAARLGCRAGALRVRLDPGVDDLPTQAAVPLDLGVDVADVLDPCEERIRLGRGVAPAEHEVEVARLARLGNVDAVLR